MKLHVILKEELGEEITHGRDSFLRFLSSEGLTLSKLKRRHTTDSNHPYRKYPNLVIGLDIQQVNQVWVPAVASTPMAAGAAVGIGAGATGGAWFVRFFG